MRTDNIEGVFAIYTKTDLNKSFWQGFAIGIGIGMVTMFVVILGVGSYLGV